MIGTPTLDRKTIQAAIDELDQISRDEYGARLERLLLDPSPEGALRVQRLVGIVLKRPFADVRGPGSYSRTGALRSWPWAQDSPESRATLAPAEFAILEELRKPGTWHETNPSAPVTWEKFRDDVETERGLFKILVLYAEDKLKKRTRRTLKDYLEFKESPRFEAGLDLATLAFDATVTAPLAALLGIPTLAVGITLVGIQYGYRLTTDTNQERVGDAYA